MLSKTGVGNNKFTISIQAVTNTNTAVDLQYTGGSLMVHSVNVLVVYY